MSHEYLLWLTLFAYGWHIAEEIILGNINYLHKVLKMKDWTANDLHILSGLGLVCAIASIMIGWNMPVIALFLPAYLITHGLLVHVWYTIRYRKINPGFFTTLFPGIPVSIWAYWGAWKDGVLTWDVAVLSLLLGTLFLVAFLILIKLRKRIKN
ncbi:MAG: HXXEE domain-containing protein [Verrucomicrobia bacterium]|nr:HXXEE domain-containing protein [Verrucomicrobiota bacterium]